MRQATVGPSPKSIPRRGRLTIGLNTKQKAGIEPAFCLFERWGSV